MSGRKSSTSRFASESQWPSSPGAGVTSTLHPSYCPRVRIDDPQIPLTTTRAPAWRSSTAAWLPSWSMMLSPMRSTRGAGDAVVTRTVAAAAGVCVSAGSNRAAVTTATGTTSESEHRTNRGIPNSIGRGSRRDRCHAADIRVLRAVHHEEPPPPPPPPPEKPPEKPLPPLDDGAAALIVPLVVTAKPSIASANASAVNAFELWYQVLVSGASAARPSNVFAHLWTQPNTIAYGRYSEKRCCCSAK